MVAILGLSLLACMFDSVQSAGQETEKPAFSNKEIVFEVGNKHHVGVHANKQNSVNQSSTRVLVVDDDQIVLEYMSHVIGAAGYEVLTATSAEGALITLQRDFAQIVILDIIMPGMDGLTLCRTIRRQTYPGYIYLMLHTSKTTDADMLDGFAAGADDYVGKGRSKDQMIERIHAAQRALALKASL
jgi:CheY-like chemotaxis protein